MDLKENDYNTLHDVILEAIGSSYTNSQIQELYNILPSNLTKDFEHWGTSDTVCRDNLYVWLREHTKEHKDNNMNLENINKSFKLNDPIKLGSAVGRIVGFDGDYIIKDGEKEYSIIYFGSPHGTLIKTGRVYIEKINTDEDLQKLKDLEDDAKEKCKWYIDKDGKVADLSLVSDDYDEDEDEQYIEQWIIDKYNQGQDRYELKYNKESLEYELYVKNGTIIENFGINDSFLYYFLYNSKWEFAKAFWGDDNCMWHIPDIFKDTSSWVEYQRDELERTGKCYIKQYEYHLQQMIISDDPIEYLKKCKG
jgi:hypothetical protein